MEQLTGKRAKKKSGGDKCVFSLNLTFLMKNLLENLWRFSTLYNIQELAKIGIRNLTFLKWSLLYRVTQNKVHPLLAILYLIFEVNFTQVSYVIQCIIIIEVQFNELQFWNCLSERNISNCAVIWLTAPFERFFTIF